MQGSLSLLLIGCEKYFFREIARLFFRNNTLAISLEKKHKFVLYILDVVKQLMGTFFIECIIIFIYYDFFLFDIIFLYYYFLSILTLFL